MGQERIDKKLQAMDDGIHGVNNNPEIAGMMSNFGYTPEKMKEGEELFEKAKGGVAGHAGSYSDQYVATSEYNKKFSTVYALYMVTLKVVRVAYKGQAEKLVRFNATGRRRRSLAGWLSDAGVLYTNLLNDPESLTLMGKFNYTTARLQEEHEMLKEVQAYHSQQLSKMGVAQQSTVDRDAAYDKACDWYSDFRGIARIALYEKPQLLEALGIVAK